MSAHIDRATATDVTDVADLVARAFQQLAVARWLAVAPTRRLTCLREQFGLLIAHAVDHGHVDVMSDGTGAAVWFARTSAIPEPPDYDERLSKICGPLLPRFVALDDAFAAHHPEEPHHHLAFLAVRQDVRQKGIGTALIEHHHRFLDQESIPAYLEASGPSTRDLYARLGYAVRSVITLPRGPRMWPMWREPRGGGGHRDVMLVAADAGPSGDATTSATRAAR